MMKRRRAEPGLSEPRVLWAGASARRITSLFVVRDNKTVRATVLDPPRGTFALVAGTLTDAASDAGRAAVRAAVGRFAPPPPTECQAPAVFTDTMLARSKLSDGLRAALEAGEVPADPDAPHVGVDLAELQPVLDLSQPHEPTPPTPEIADYAAYELPPDTPNRYLERVNGTDRDRLLRFVENTHTYFVRRADGVERPTNGSVTYLAHKYEVAFNRESAVAKLLASRNWPRARYCVAPFRAAALTDIKNCDCVAYVDDQGSVLETVELNFRRMRSEADVFVAERPLTGDEIKRDWELLALRASNRGTEIHYQIELFLNRDACHAHTAEFASFASFAKRVMIPLGMVAYRTEWRIFCERTNVAGSVDCVVRLPDGTLGIIDWKRSTKVRDRLVGTGAPFEVSMHEPMDHLDGVVTAGYALQLNLYKYILETCYGATVSCLILAQVDSEDDFYTFVPDMDLEARYIMTAREAENLSDSTPPEARAEVEGRTQRAYEELLAGRMPWTDMMPPCGITIEGWRRGEARAVANEQRRRAEAGAGSAKQEILFHM